MADKKPTTVGDAGSFKLPTIAIPKSAQRNEYGWPVFSIQTPVGEIIVRCCYRYAICAGSIDALVVGGFMLPEWAPGLPGNNATRQTVAFSPDGPRLLIGNRRGSRTTDPHITVIRVSRRSLGIEVPLTEEQKQLIEAAQAEHKEESRFHAARDGAPSPEGARVFYCNIAENAIVWIRKNMADTGCTYTRESMNRIQQSFEGLRRAFADGRVVPLVPKYQRVGNVVCWPGRGSVAAVAPTLLQN